jgi:hypothetical protein
MNDNISQLTTPGDGLLSANKIQAPFSGDIIDEVEFLRRIPVSRGTASAWRRDKKIPFIRIGRRILFSWSSVESALRRMEKGGAL